MRKADRDDVVRLTENKPDEEREMITIVPKQGTRGEEERRKRTVEAVVKITEARSLVGEDGLMEILSYLGVMEPREEKPVEREEPLPLFEKPRTEVWITLNEAAARVGCSPSTIRNWSQDETNDLRQMMRPYKPTAFGGRTRRMMVSQDVLDQMFKPRKVKTTQGGR